MERFISDNTTLDQEKCLLDQKFIKDEKKTVAEYVHLMVMLKLQVLNVLL